MTSKDRS